MKRIILLSALASSIILSIGCGQKKHHKQKVQCYRAHHRDDAGNDTWLYYYLFWSANNQSCYYYNSPYPVSNYSTVNWQTSATSPLQALDKEQVETLPEENVAPEQMNEEMQTQMDDTPENFGGMTEDEKGDYEGTDDNNSNGGINASENSGSNSSEGSESDAGSSGGDSGGGDSGGGGGSD